MQLVRRICSSYHYKRYRIVRSLISGEGRNLLDIGCGPPSTGMKEGAFLEFIGYGEGMDIEPRHIRFKFTLGSIESIPFGDNKFDAVTALEVIEHVRNPELAFKEVHRILRDRGVFVVSTPNNNIVFRVFWFLWGLFVGGMWKDTHLSSFDRKTWVRIVRKQALFRIERLSTIWGMNLTFKLRKV